MADFDPEDMDFLSEGGQIRPISSYEHVVAQRFRVSNMVLWGGGQSKARGWDEKEARDEMSLL
jgi:hypothetical protein